MTWRHTVLLLLAYHREYLCLGNSQQSPYICQIIVGFHSGIPIRAPSSSTELCVCRCLVSFFRYHGASHDRNPLLNFYLLWRNSVWSDGWLISRIISHPFLSSCVRSAYRNPLMTVGNRVSKAFLLSFYRATGTQLLIVVIIVLFWLLWPLRCGVLGILQERRIVPNGDVVLNTIRGRTPEDCKR